MKLEFVLRTPEESPKGCRKFIETDDQTLLFCGDFWRDTRSRALCRECGGDRLGDPVKFPKPESP